MPVVFGVQGTFNAILTGAAFLDAERAFPVYWSEAYAKGRR